MWLVLLPICVKQGNFHLSLKNLFCYSTLLTLCKDLSLMLKLMTKFCLAASVFKT